MEEASRVTGEHVQALFIGLLLSIVTSGIAWQKGFYCFPGSKKEGEQGVLSFMELCGAFAVFLGITLFFTPSLVAIWHFFQGQASLTYEGDASQQMGAWETSLDVLLRAMGMLVYCALLTPSAKRAVWGSNAFSGGWRVLRDIVTGMGTLLISYPLVIVFGQLVALLVWVGWQSVNIDQVAVHYLKMTLSYPYLFLVTLLVIAFIIPVIEELLFRGFLQSWLRGKVGKIKAIVITSVIFALFHFSAAQGMSNPELLISLFVLSCFLGFIFERQQSLWASIALHAIFNTTSALTIFYVNSL